MSQRKECVQQAISAVVPETLQRQKGLDACLKHNRGKYIRRERLVHISVKYLSAVTKSVVYILILWTLARYLSGDVFTSHDGLEIKISELSSER